MERTCSVCGGQKAYLFSSTYCPRCEDAKSNPVLAGNEFPFLNWRDALSALEAATGKSAYMTVTQGAGGTAHFGGLANNLVPFLPGPVPWDCVSYWARILVAETP